MLAFVHDMTAHAGWEARHVGNVLRDLYVEPRYAWHIDFIKNPADEKANFWARTYGALDAFREGRLTL